MRYAIAEAIFWLHMVIVGIWLGLLFVPFSWWKGKIAFHFFLTLAIIFHQFLWGAFLLPWSRKYGPACVLTTVMQWARGLKTSDVHNYRHSWTMEFVGRMGWSMPMWGAAVLPLFLLLVTGFQYFTSR
jgi:hypothetical protein